MNGGFAWCLQLVLEWGVGIAVLVRCFVDKRGIEHQIIDKLGNGFSRAPFATVVVSFSQSDVLLAMRQHPNLECIPIEILNGIFNMYPWFLRPRSIDSVARRSMTSSISSICNLQATFERGHVVHYLRFLYQEHGGLSTPNLFFQAICTLVSLLASIPLGELFFFHLILIRKV